MTMRIDYRYWRLFSVLGFAIGVGLLVLVLLPAIPPLIQPVEANGATRWLKIGGLPQFHPAEFAKLALVVYLAHWLTARGSEVGSIRRGLLPFLAIVGLVAGLVILEPDLGTTGVLVLTGFTMFFVAGGSIWQLLLLVPVGIAGVAALLIVNPYQMSRWTTFLDPWAVASGEGYQTIHGLYALALGGVFGQGLGQSRQPSGLALPAAENDFIFAVVGQEFGLWGGLLVIGLFLLLAWRGIRIAMRAPDTFGGLLAMGITAWLAFQAFVNIGVVVQLLPLTGLPLPFLSDGGTSLVVALAAVGILLSISRESVPRGASAHEDPHRSRGHRRPHLPRSGHRPAAGDAAT
jgi:cell division protein FtsW